MNDLALNGFMYPPVHKATCRSKSASEASDASRFSGELVALELHTRHAKKLHTRQAKKLHIRQAKKLHIRQAKKLHIRQAIELQITLAKNCT